MYLSHEFGTVGILDGVYCIARLHTNAHQYSDNIRHIQLEHLANGQNHRVTRSWLIPHPPSPIQEGGNGDGCSNKCDEYCNLPKILRCWLTFDKELRFPLILQGHKRNVRTVRVWSSRDRGER